MEKISHDIERSARKVFKLFFGSRLYLRKDVPIFDGELIGVDMRMTYNGERVMSLHMERRMIESLKEQLGTSGGDIWVDHDFVGEMANMIAGGALSSSKDTACLYPPEKARGMTDCSRENMRIFSSRMGRFCISIGDYALQ